ncbi:MAG TPA: c-type cytochrome [Planctomycetota bacterium]|nr:c-type cytochrome [Planctomycetota bacterium]
MRRVAPALLLLAAVQAGTIRAGDEPQAWKLEGKCVVPADRHERPVLVLVTDPWSRSCRRFESEALASDAVRAALARDWLCARVETPDEAWGVGTLPSLVVLDRYGAFVERIEGERPAEILQGDLTLALEAARSHEEETRSLLETRGGTVAERLERTSALVRRGLLERAVPGLEELVRLDPANQEGAGLFALATLGKRAFRRGALAEGDRLLAQVATLGSGTRVVDLRRERAQALRKSGEHAAALAELGRVRALAARDEAERLDLDAAAILDDAGRGDEARALLERLWDSGSDPVRALAEAALDRDGAPGDWRILRDGRRLVQKFGCAECHEIESAVALDVRASCVRCHQEMKKGFATEAELRDALAAEPRGFAAQRNVRHWVFAPDLSTVLVRLERDWVRAFLRHPVDVRPFMAESMPRLPLSDGEAETLLDYLEVVGRRAAGPIDATALPPGDVRRGERLFQEKGCVSCHIFGNRVFAGSPAGTPWPRVVTPNLRAAPNLRWVRDRARRDVLPLWIRNPRRFVKDSLMPTHDATDGELADLIAFLETGDLGKPAPLPEAARPPEARGGRFGEAREIFHDTCKHCHHGDDEGGIGNAGGFGYGPIGLDLDTPSGPSRGSVGPDGRRRPVLSGALVERLLWRRDENRWDAWAPYRDPLLPIPTERYDHPSGMPLGLPALDDADLALLEGLSRDASPRPSRSR